MIRFTRPVGPPARLASHGAPELQRICNVYDADAAVYFAGPKTLEFKPTIYGHASVKSVLQKAQSDKCCYCEGIFHGHAAGDVDHFRPKSYCQQEAKSARSYPGYYWLAYHWNNLLFCCQVCNRSHKRNLFPLSNPTARVRARDGNLATESPLLLDPAGADDPRDHIHFHQEVPVGVTDRGRETVKVLKLDRISLNDLRREQLNKLKTLRDAVKVLETTNVPGRAKIMAEARALLDEAVRPTAIYSAMARDLLQPRPAAQPAT